MSDEVKQIDPKSAYALLQENPKAVLIDIRSSMEFLFVGHAQGAVHIAWMDEPDWTVNPHFVQQVRQLMLGGIADDTHTTPILLICRSGRRSKDAGLVLVQAGIKDVYSVSEGFEGDLNEHHQRSTVGGWRYHGLPWEQC